MKIRQFELKLVAEEMATHHNLFHAICDSLKKNKVKHWNYYGRIVNSSFYDRSEQPANKKEQKQNMKYQKYLPLSKKMQSISNFHDKCIFNVITYTTV